MNKGCETCRQWQRIDPAEIYGYCPYFKIHTTIYYGDTCTGFQGPQSTTVRQERLKPGTLYEKALQVIAGRDGEKVSVISLKVRLHCTWPEAAALIDKLETDGKIEKVKWQTTIYTLRYTPAEIK